MCFCVYIKKLLFVFHLRYIWCNYVKKMLLTKMSFRNAFNINKYKTWQSIWGKCFHIMTGSAEPWPLRGGALTLWAPCFSRLSSLGVCILLWNGEAKQGLKSHQAEEAEFEALSVRWSSWNLEGRVLKKDIALLERSNHGLCVKIHHGCWANCWQLISRKDLLKISCCMAER